MTTPAQPDDLITWLRAQLDARERAAHLIKQHGLANLLPAAIINGDGATVFFTEEAYTLISDALDPDAMLAEVDAKRRILDQCEQIADMSFVGSEFSPGDDTELAAWTIAVLALPYADRPGYRDEWKP